MEQAPLQPPPRRRRWLRRLGLGLGLGLVLISSCVAYRLRDRTNGYALDLSVAPPPEPAPLRVGFGRVRINPDLSDPERPVWLAGFSMGRAATAIHDDLWAVACVIDDGTTRVGVVSLDAIGFFLDDVVSVRRRLPEALGLDHTVVAATHNHSTPDLMGLWVPPLRGGVDPGYREHVIAACVEALSQGVTGLQSAQLSSLEVVVDPAGLVKDTRPPEVYDPDLRMLWFRDGEGRTLGSIVTWANHPETPWSKNTEVTADFPGVLRDALEHGLDASRAGLGGTHVFINGAVGGLMTTHPSVAVPELTGGGAITKPSHAKSRAVGLQLARRLLKAADPQLPAVERVGIGIQAMTLDLPVDNPKFLLAPVLGFLDRGHVELGYLRTEVGLITLGDASLLCVPGEIYPELVNGGVVRAPGGDFDQDPVEVPPLRDLMPGRVKMILGLANDEVGYIIPRSEWDTEPPYLYGAEKGVYGESNSPGPETAPLLHAAFRELLERASGAR